MACLYILFERMAIVVKNFSIPELEIMQLKDKDILTLSNPKNEGYVSEGSSGDFNGDDFIFE